VLKRNDTLEENKLPEFNYNMYAKHITYI